MANDPWEEAGAAYGQPQGPQPGAPTAANQNEIGPTAPTPLPVIQAPPAARLTALSGTPPAAGADAQTYGPQVGVHPDVALGMPSEVKTKAQAQTNAATVANSPSLTSWFHSASNAAVAAVQDELPSLASIGDLFSRSLPRRSPLTEPTYAAWDSLVQAYDHSQQALARGDIVGAASESGKQALAAVQLGLSPIGGIYNAAVDPLARGFVRSGMSGSLLEGITPSTNRPFGPLIHTPTTMTDEEQVNYWKTIGGLFAGLIGGGEEAVPGETTAGIQGGREAPPPYKPSAPTSPGHIPTDENGYVLNLDGSRMQFPTQREAGKFAVATHEGSDQIFDMAVHPDDLGPPFSVKEIGRTDVPWDGKVPPPGVDRVADTLYTAQADAEVERVAAAQKAIAASPINKRVPAVMEDFLGHTGAAGETAYVDPRALITAAQEAGLPLTAEERTGVTDALAAGREVAVPLTRYLAATAGQPFAEELNRSTRFSEEGVSQDEAKTRGSQAPTGVEKAAGAVEAGKADAGVVEGAQRAVELPPDIPAEHVPAVRAIAARSEAAIERVVQEHGLAKLAGVPTLTGPAGEMQAGVEGQPAALGMTKAQFGRYGAALDEWKAGLHERLLNRAYSAIRAARTPEWKAEVAQRSAEVERELTSSRQHGAYMELAQGTGPLGEPLERPSIKLSRPRTVAAYGQHTVDALPKSMFRNTTDEALGALHPDEAAELLHYDSGEALLHDMLNAETDRVRSGLSYKKFTEQAIKVEAERRVLAAHPEFDVSREALERAAREAVTEPQITDLLIDEWKEIGREAGLPVDASMVKAKAQEGFNKLPTKVGANPKFFVKALNRIGRHLETALEKQKWPEALLSKEHQILNQIQLQMSWKMAKRVAQDQKSWRRVAKKVLLPNTAQDAVNWTKDILATMGMKVRGNPDDLTPPINGFNSLGEFIAAKNMLGAEIISAPVPRQSPDDMRVSQYMGVSNMIRSILKTGRAEMEVQVGEEKRNLEETVDAGIAQLARYSRNIPQEKEGAYLSLLERMDRARRYVDAWLVRMEQLMRDFGERDPHSPFFQVVSRRLEAAKGWGRDERLAQAKRLVALDKEVGPGFDAWLKTKLPAQGLHAEIKNSYGDPLFQFNKDVTVAALHLGDQEALRKFAEGRDTTPEMIEAVVREHMTAQMQKFVEGIWAEFNHFRPAISEMYRRLTGVTPMMVEPRPFTLASNSQPTWTSKGGYFPVLYDAAVMPKEWLNMLDPEAMLGDRRYTRATPTNGYIKERTGVSAPIQMSLTQIPSRLNQIIHDLTYREALIDIQKFLMHPRMAQAIARKYGPEYVDKLRRNLERIAGSESTDPNENRAVSATVDWVTEGQMVNMIGMSPTTLMKHGPTAVVQAVAEVNAARLASNYWNYLRDMDEVGGQAERESPEIRHIISTYGEDSYRQYLRLVGKKNISFTRFAFHVLGFVNKQVAIATYFAAKDMLADKYPDLDEAAIQAAANQIVRQALGSAGPTDAPDALSAGRSVPGRFYRLNNNFLTFLSHMYNKSREIPQSLGYAGDKVDLGRALALTIAAIILPVWIDQQVSREFKKVVGPWLNKGASWLETMAFGAVHQFVAPVPGLNTAVGAGMHTAAPEDYQASGNTLESLGQMVGVNIVDLRHAIEDHAWRNAYTRHLIVTAGQFGHAPGLELSRLEGFIYAAMKGKEQDMSKVGQILEDLVYGPKEPPRPHPRTFNRGRHH